jgi:hypothetical protein
VDVDVQVNLEVAASSTNAARLEQALLNAEFEVDSEKQRSAALPEKAHK